MHFYVVERTAQAPNRHVPVLRRQLQARRELALEQVRDHREADTVYVERREACVGKLGVAERHTQLLQYRVVSEYLAVDRKIRAEWLTETRLMMPRKNGLWDMQVKYIASVAEDRMGRVFWGGYLGSASSNPPFERSGARAERQACRLQGNAYCVPVVPAFAGNFEVLCRVTGPA
jgi:hypothetical protein